MIKSGLSGQSADKFIEDLFNNVPIFFCLKY